MGENIEKNMGENLENMESNMEKTLNGRRDLRVQRASKRTHGLESLLGVAVLRMIRARSARPSTLRLELRTSTWSSTLRLASAVGAWENDGIEHISKKWP